jgi:hypothetical protein
LPSASVAQIIDQEYNLIEVLFEVCWSRNNPKIMSPWPVLLRAATLVFSIVHALASPFGNENAQDPADGLLLNLTQNVGDDGLYPRAEPFFYLRVMPLGASITMGAGSTDGNGYRKHIRDQLRYGKTAFWFKARPMLYIFTFSRI